MCPAAHRGACPSAAPCGAARAVPPILGRLVLPKPPAVGIEPTTSGSGNRRASIAPRGLAKVGHGHAGARTQDLRLIRATLYRLSYTTRRSCSRREWSSGRMAPCHGVGPGSIPGSRMFFSFACSLDKTSPPVGLEPTTTRLRALRSTD